MLQPYIRVGDDSRLKMPLPVKYRDINVRREVIEGCSGIRHEVNVVDVEGEDVQLTREGAVSLQDIKNSLRDLQNY